MKLYPTPLNTDHYWARWVHLRASLCVLGGGGGGGGRGMTAPRGFLGNFTSLLLTNDGNPPATNNTNAPGPKRFYMTSNFLSSFFPCWNRVRKLSIFQRCPFWPETDPQQCLWHEINWLMTNLKCKQTKPLKGRRCWNMYGEGGRRITLTPCGDMVYVTNQTKRSGFTVSLSGFFFSPKEKSTERERLRDFQYQENEIWHAYVQSSMKIIIMTNYDYYDYCNSDIYSWWDFIDLNSMWIMV